MKVSPKGTKQAANNKKEVIIGHGGDAHVQDSAKGRRDI